MNSDDKATLYLEYLKKISNQVDEVKEQSKDTQDRVVKLDKKQDLMHQEMRYEIKAINELDEKQNEELREHIAGVNTLKKMHIEQKTYFEERLEQQKDHFDGRLRKVEAPKEVWKTFRNWTIGAGALAGALFAIGRLFGLL